LEMRNQTCQDELEISMSSQKLGKDKINEPDSEAADKIKFEFGAEPEVGEPSPKTPEFSEIAEMIARNSIFEIIKCDAFFSTEGVQ